VNGRRATVGATGRRRSATIAATVSAAAALASAASHVRTSISTCRTASTRRGYTTASSASARSVYVMTNSHRPRQTPQDRPVCVVSGGVN